MRFAILLFGVALSAQTPFEASVESRILYSTTTPVFVDAGRVYSRPLNIKEGGCRIVGSVLARGGTNDDIEVRVMVGQGLSVYNSGMRHFTKLNVEIERPGMYEVVFDNRSSLVSRKTVWSWVNVACDAPRPTHRPEESMANAQIHELLDRALVAGVSAQSIKDYLEVLIARAGKP